MQPEKRLATEEDLKQIKQSEKSEQEAVSREQQSQLFEEEKRYVPRYDYDDTPKKPEKPKVRLGYEHIEHLHRGSKDFERAICRNDFIQKYSQYQNILQFLALFRERQGLSPYDPLPETELNGYIAEKTPFESWQEFLVAAYEHQATTDEIEALLDRDYQGA